MGGRDRGNLLEVVARSSRECGEVGEKAGKIRGKGKGAARAAESRVENRYLGLTRDAQKAENIMRGRASRLKGYMIQGLVSKTGQSSYNTRYKG